MSAANRKERNLALAQTMAIVGGLAGIALLGTWATRAPAEASELRIPLAELRSQTTELALLGREFEAGHVNGMFASAHTQQLAKSIRQSLKALASLDVVPDLRATQQDGVAEGRGLMDAVSRFQNGGSIPTADAERRRERLGNLERSLRN